MRKYVYILISSAHRDDTDSQTIDLSMAHRQCHVCFSNGAHVARASTNGSLAFKLYDTTITACLLRKWIRTQMAVKPRWASFILELVMRWLTLHVDDTVAVPARALAGTVSTVKLNMYASKFNHISIILFRLYAPDDSIQNDRWDIATHRSHVSHRILKDYTGGLINSVSASPLF